MPSRDYEVGQTSLNAELPTPGSLDAVDERILAELQRDAKITNVELAHRVHLSPSPCLTRVRNLEATGVVKRYVALVDAYAVGLGVSVFIQISLEKQIDKALVAFEETVRRLPQIMECYLMTGDSDYLLRVVVADVNALQDFIVNELTRIPGISKIRSSFALKQVKFETALPLRGVVTRSPRGLPRSLVGLAPARQRRNR
jgi:Lrp/AsnC family transcriptional regulator, leucine-responsive regulatory protein